MDNSPLSWLASNYVWLIMVAGSTGAALKFYLERGDRNTDKRTSAEVEAVKTITSYVGMLKDDLANTKTSDREKDAEIKQLEVCVDDLTTKLRKARLDVLDLRQSVKDFRRFVAEHNISDEKFTQTLDDLERQLKEIGECLK